MDRIEMIERAGGIRALTESEVAMVGGGLDWGKIIGVYAYNVLACISPTAQMTFNALDLAFPPK